jgi:hypothetical protein
MPPHECNQGDKFNALHKQIAQVKLDNESKMAEIKADLDEHREAQQLQDIEREKRLIERQKHDKELQVFMTSANETLELVKSKIIPAYDREVNAENAKKWIKEQAKSGSFWMGILMSVIAFFITIGMVIKQLLK